MVAATAPLNVRLATLALWWWMPAGLAELAGLVAGHDRPDRIVRAVGVCSLVALVALSLEGARLWCESVLLGMSAFIR
jgi:hypothetical protein